jgi:hypothetical protein
VAQAVISVGSAGTLSLPFMGTQIMGGSYNKSIEEGATHEDALNNAILNAVLQTPLEQIGIGKATKFIKVKKRILKRLKNMAESAGVEGLTEALQEFPDAWTNLMAKNPDESKLKLLWDTVSNPETWKSAGASAAVGATLGGGVSTVSNVAGATMEGAQDVATQVTKRAIESKVRDKQPIQVEPDIVVPVGSSLNLEQQLLKEAQGVADVQTQKSIRRHADKIDKRSKAKEPVQEELAESEEVTEEEKAELEAIIEDEGKKQEAKKKLDLKKAKFKPGKAFPGVKKDAPKPKTKPEFGADKGKAREYGEEVKGNKKAIAELKRDRTKVQAQVEGFKKQKKFQEAIDKAAESDAIGEAIDQAEGKAPVERLKKDKAKVKPKKKTDAQLQKDEDKAKLRALKEVKEENARKRAEKTKKKEPGKVPERPKAEKPKKKPFEKLKETIESKEDVELDDPKTKVAFSKLDKVGVVVDDKVIDTEDLPAITGAGVHSAVERDAFQGALEKLKERHGKDANIKIVDKTGKTHDLEDLGKKIVKSQQKREDKALIGQKERQAEEEAARQARADKRRAAEEEELRHLTELDDVQAERYETLKNRILNKAVAHVTENNPDIADDVRQELKLKMLAHVRDPEKIDKGFDAVHLAMNAATDVQNIYGKGRHKTKTTQFPEDTEAFASDKEAIIEKDRDQALIEEAGITTKLDKMDKEGNLVGPTEIIEQLTDRIETSKGSELTAAMRLRKRVQGTYAPKGTMDTSKIQDAKRKAELIRAKELDIAEEKKRSEAARKEEDKRVIQAKKEGKLSKPKKIIVEGREAVGAGVTSKTGQRAGITQKSTEGTIPNAKIKEIARRTGAFDTSKYKTEGKPNGDPWIDRNAAMGNLIKLQAKDRVKYEHAEVVSTQVKDNRKGRKGKTRRAFVIRIPHLEKGVTAKEGTTEEIKGLRRRSVDYAVEKSERLLQEARMKEFKAEAKAGEEAARAVTTMPLLKEARAKAEKAKQPPKIEEPPRNIVKTTTKPPRVVKVEGEKPNRLLKPDLTKKKRRVGDKLVRPAVFGGWVVTDLDGSNWKGTKSGTAYKRIEDANKRARKETDRPTETKVSEVILTGKPGDNLSGKDYSELRKQGWTYKQAGLEQTTLGNRTHPDHRMLITKGGIKKPVILIRPKTETEERLASEKTTAVKFRGKVYRSSGIHGQIKVDIAEKTGASLDIIETNSIDGFVTDKGRFVDRHTALQIAKRSKQLGTEPVQTAEEMEDFGLDTVDLDLDQFDQEEGPKPSIIGNDRGGMDVNLPGLNRVLTIPKKLGERYTKGVDTLAQKTAQWKPVKWLANTAVVDTTLHALVERYGVSATFETIEKDYELSIHRARVEGTRLAKAIEEIDGMFETSIQTTFGDTKVGTKRDVLEGLTGEKRAAMKRALDVRKRQIAEGGITTFDDKYASVKAASEAFERMEKELSKRGLLKDHQFKSMNRRERKKAVTLIRALDTKMKDLENSDIPVADKVKSHVRLNRARVKATKRLQIHYKNSGKNYLTHIKDEVAQAEKFMNQLSMDAMRKKWAKRRGNWTTKVEDGVVKVRKVKPKKLLDTAELVGKGLRQEAHDLHLHDLFTNIAKHSEEYQVLGDDSPWATEEKNIIVKRSRDGNKTSKGVHNQTGKKYVKMPNKDTNFGPLAGMWIQKSIHSELKNNFKEIDEYRKAWNKIFATWKAGKTVWNPATTTRNIGSNFALSHILGEVNWAKPSNWKMLSDSIIEYRDVKRGLIPQDQYAKEIIEDTTIYASDFATAEIGKDGGDHITKLIKMLGEKSPHEGMGQLLMKYSDVGPWFYGMMEVSMKSVVYKNARQNLGLSKEAAEKLAHQALFDYSKIPPAIRFARNWYSPFITFSYKALPRLAKQAVRKPWKMIPYLGLMYLMEEGVQMMFGEDDEEREAQKRILPDYISRDSLPHVMESHVRMPFRTPDGRDKYLDLSFFFPWGSATDMAEGALSWMPSVIAPNNPVFNLAASWKSNTDLFTGEELILDTDDGYETAIKLFESAYNDVMPAVLNFKKWDKVMGAVFGHTNVMNQPKHSVADALVDIAFGIKFRNIDYLEQTLWRHSDYQDEMNEIRDQYRKELNKVIVRESNDFRNPSQEKIHEKYSKKMEDWLDRVNYTFMREGE